MNLLKNFLSYIVDVLERKATVVEITISKESDPNSLQQLV